MASKILDDLKEQVKATVGAEESAVIAFQGFAARQQAAIDAALANGATAEELKPVQDEVTALKNSSDALAAAVVANAS